MKPLCTYSLKHPLWASFSLLVTQGDGSFVLQNAPNHGKLKKT